MHLMEDAEHYSDKPHRLPVQIVDKAPANAGAFNCQILLMVTR